jgi:hypothetical protein
MSKQTHKTQGGSHKKAHTRNQRVLWFSLAAVVVLAAAAASLLLFRADAPGTGASGQDVLHGRWLRTDGGYVLEIQPGDAAGSLAVSYFNPKSIHVSKAEAFLEGGALGLFVELTDVGYPGATYHLTYGSERDVLTGIYYQPSAGRGFDVIFVRLDEEQATP